MRPIFRKLSEMNNGPVSLHPGRYICYIADGRDNKVIQFRRSLSLCPGIHSINVCMRTVKLHLFKTMHLLLEKETPIYKPTALKCMKYERLNRHQDGRNS